MVLVLEIILVIYSYYAKGSYDNSILIIDGNIIFNNLIKNKISITKLLFELKSKNINILDNNLCLILKNNRLFLYNKCSNNKYINLLYINNCINIEGLRNISKDKKWFYDILDNNYCNINDIKLAFSFDKHLYIIKK